MIVDGNQCNNLNCVMNFSCNIDQYSVSNGKVKIVIIIKVSKVTILKNTKGHNIFKGAKCTTRINNLEISF